jgi:hypothetical protein
VAVEFHTGIDLQGNKAEGMADPSALTDGVNLQTLQNYVGGLAWKNEVRAATTAAGTLATSFENGDTIDGVVLATGDRILIKNQASPIENGIYVVAASGAPARAGDADTTADLNNATVSVTTGTANAGLSFTQTTANPTIGVSNIVWAQFNVGVSYSADGDGIELTGTVFSLELDGSSLSKSGTGLKVANAFVTAMAGAGLTEASQVLAVGAGTGITVNANDVAINTSVVVRKYSATFGNGSATTFNLSHGLGSQTGIAQIHRVSDGEIVMADILLPPAGSTVDVTFAVAPASNAYRLVYHA